MKREKSEQRGKRKEERGRRKDGTARIWKVMSRTEFWSLVRKSDSHKIERINEGIIDKHGFEGGDQHSDET